MLSVLNQKLRCSSDFREYVCWFYSYVSYQLFYNSNWYRYEHWPTSKIRTISLSNGRKSTRRSFENSPFQQIPPPLLPAGPIPNFSLFSHLIVLLHAYATRDISCCCCCSDRTTSSSSSRLLAQASSVVVVVVLVSACPVCLFPADTCGTRGFFHRKVSLDISFFCWVSFRGRRWVKSIGTGKRVRLLYLIEKV